MKLLYLNHNVAGTGTYQRAFNLAREAAARGHEVTLVTTSATARFAVARRDVDGVRQVEAPDLWWGAARTGWDPWNTARRITGLAGERFDLVHAFDSRPAVVFPALAVRRRTGATLVMDWADWWGRGGTIEERSSWLVRSAFGPVETWFEEAFRGRADGTTVISEALERRALGLGVTASRLLRFPNGCASPGRRVGRAEARARLGLRSATPLLVHLGVLARRDMALLMETLRRVRAERAGVRLALVGRPGSSAAPELVAAGAVLLPGYVSPAALGDWLAAADLCVLALSDTLANRARWPGRVNEYFSAGRATVMPRVGDAAPILERNGAGWTTSPTPEGLAEAVLGALDDPESLAAAGEAARRAAGTALAWRRVAERLDVFYRTLTTEREAVYAATA